jgi:hypothetical protein
MENDSASCSKNILICASDSEDSDFIGTTIPQKIPEKWCQHPTTHTQFTKNHYCYACLETLKKKCCRYYQCKFCDKEIVWQRRFEHFRKHCPNSVSLIIMEFSRAATWGNKLKELLRDDPEIGDASVDVFNTYEYMQDDNLNLAVGRMIVAVIRHLEVNFNKGKVIIVLTGHGCQSQYNCIETSLTVTKSVKSEIDFVDNTFIKTSTAVGELLDLFVTSHSKVTLLGLFLGFCKGFLALDAIDISMDIWVAGYCNEVEYNYGIYLELKFFKFLIKGFSINEKDKDDILFEIFHKKQCILDAVVVSLPDLVIGMIEMPLSLCLPSNLFEKQMDNVYLACNANRYRQKFKEFLIKQTWNPNKVDFCECLYTLNPEMEVNDIVLDMFVDYINVVFHEWMVRYHIHIVPPVISTKWFDQPIENEVLKKTWNDLYVINDENYMLLMPYKIFKHWALVSMTYTRISKYNEEFAVHVWNSFLDYEAEVFKDSIVKMRRLVVAMITAAKVKHYTRLRDKVINSKSNWNVNFPRQNDAFNCGIFVMYTIEGLVRFTSACEFEKMFQNNTVKQSEISIMRKTIFDNLKTVNAYHSQYIKNTVPVPSKKQKK